MKGRGKRRGSERDGTDNGSSEEMGQRLERTRVVWSVSRSFTTFTSRYTRREEE